MGTESTEPLGERSSRRVVLRGAGLLAAAGALGVGGHQVVRYLRGTVDPRTAVSLYSATVAIDEDGSRHLVPAGTGDASLPGPTTLSLDPGADLGLVPGTRLLQTASSPSAPTSTSVPPSTQPLVSGAPAERAAQFFESARPFLERAATAGWEDLATSALWDLWVLSDGLPAPVAGWSRNWRFIWPRDAAFGAVALARTGHPATALRALLHLQELQGEDGWFEARYVPGTPGVPDGRARQFDGTGLALWAASEILTALPDRDRAPAAAGLSGLLDRSTDVLLGSTRDGTRLPPVSPDYWEVGERSVTLGIMASTLAGLRGGAALSGEERTGDAAEAFADLTRRTFGPAGFQRYRRRGGADSARAFFAATGSVDLIDSVQLISLRRELGRPAGGIAPGAGWKQDGISWTPSTSLLALALARSGEREQAAEVLDWIAAHRTAAGSIPEKVLHDGSPAAVAPLSWSAANVLLGIDALTAPE
jgi:hypothetical protein